MSESITDILAREDKNWKDAEVTKNNYSTPIADGVYHSIISDAKLTTSKKGNAMLILELTVETGKGGGRKLNTYNLLSGQGLTYTKQKIDTLGVACEAITDLVPLVQKGKFIGIAIQIKVVSVGDNQNVYFQKRLDIAEEYPTEEEADAGDGIEPEGPPW